MVYTSGFQSVGHPSPQVGVFFLGKLYSTIELIIILLFNFVHCFLQPPDRPVQLRASVCPCSSPAVSSPMSHALAAPSWHLATLSPAFSCFFVCPPRASQQLTFAAIRSVLCIVVAVSSCGGSVTLRSHLVSNLLKCIEFQPCSDGYIFIVVTRGSTGIRQRG